MAEGVGSSSVLEKEEEREGLTPWEQHSTVISIPRFDYKAPSSLLAHSHAGFLITCPIKREKSATKEVISILEKYIGSLSGNCSEIVENSDVDSTAKRRKISLEKKDGEHFNNVESNGPTNILESGDSSVGDLSTENDQSAGKMDESVDCSNALSLVKLKSSGLLLLIFPGNISPDTVYIVSEIFHSMVTGTLKRPLWCHRIFPIQATCSLNEKDLRMVVSKLVRESVDDKRNELGRPLKFAVGFNRRGIEETEIKVHESTTDPNLFALLDRNKCFNVVAAAVKDAIADSVVDLRHPELSVLVELLPISGVPRGSLVVAVSVLPHNLISTKPRLCIKALISDTKTKNGRN